MFKIADNFKQIARKNSNNMVVNMIKNNPWFQNVTFKTLFPNFSLIFIVSHLFTCLWHYFSFYSATYNTWLDRNGYRDNSGVSRYISSFYFVYQTITTVGYGDVGVETSTEFVFSILLMFIGVVFYSSLLTKLLELIARANMEQDITQQKFELLKEVHRKTNLPRHIFAYIREQAEDALKENQDQTYTKETIPSFKGVNREDVFDLLYENYIWRLKKCRLINLFADAGHKDFIVAFGSNMVKTSFSKGDLIYQKGQPSNYFYLMETGTVQFLMPKYGSEKDNRLPFFEVEDSFFGEQEIIKVMEVREFTCVAKTNVECFVVDKIDFLEILASGDEVLKNFFLKKHSQRQIETTRAFS